MTDSSTVLISGVGQLGSRYLQGLIACSNRLRVFIQDPDAAARAIAIRRWDDAGGASSLHVVSAHEEIADIPQNLDLAIVATTAAVRPIVVEQVANRAAVRMWILEKVLAQNSDGLDRIQDAVGMQSAAWVNTWARTTPWYQRIRGNRPHSPVRCSVEGGSWGLACNAVHFLDLISWWSGETLVDVNAKGLDHKWLPGKRPGNFEVSGVLVATYSGGSVCRLSAGLPDNASELAGSVNPDFLQIEGESSAWMIVEPFASETGLARSSDGSEISGRIELQSERTTGLVNHLLDNGTADLPDLAVSIVQHRLFLDAMLDRWRESHETRDDLVPIT